MLRLRSNWKQFQLPSPLRFCELLSYISSHTRNARKHRPRHGKRNYEKTCRFPAESQSRNGMPCRIPFRKSMIRDITRFTSSPFHIECHKKQAKWHERSTVRYVCQIYARPRPCALRQNLQAPGWAKAVRFGPIADTLTEMIFYL